MISQTLEYALRAIVTLAQHEDRPMVTAKIAETTKMPPGYLYKVLQQLARGGLVQSQRGLKGGYILARSPADISVLNVVDVMDPLKRIHTCPLELETHGSELCALHRLLDNTMDTIERTFAATTILDLLSDPERPYPLCRVQPQG